MGYGDDIMATAEARELKRLYPASKIVVGDGVSEYPSPIFEGNPNICRLVELHNNDNVIWLKNYRGCRPYIDYSKSDMSRRAYFKQFKARPGDLFLSTAILEYANAAFSKPESSRRYVFIEPNAKLKSNKDWGFENWQSVVDGLSDRATFIQPVYFGVSLLENVIGIKTPSFLHGCGVLSRCDYFLGTEGGLHHAAAALSVPGVVLFGGRIPPQITGYDCHINVYVDDPDSPCGMFAPCPHCAECWKQITPSLVINTIHNLMFSHKPSHLQNVILCTKTTPEEITLT